MKKDELMQDILNINDTMSSLLSRTNDILQENDKSEHDHVQKEIFWKNQKNDFEKILLTLHEDSNFIKNKLKLNIVDTEKLINQFRNKSKSDNLKKVNDRVDRWKLEEYITQERFKKILQDELKS
ncbi:hypothetical protein GOV08_00785 [Candidatus Woesearchaeota archaeon]|nr:hypothetical protein [Candidatus Woesearchaeota archaeon]